MSGSLIIQQPGNSVVTDLGRFRGPRFGLPVNGALDQYSARTANILAGNDDTVPLLEVTALDFRMRATTDLLIAVTGTPLQLTVGGRECRQWEPVSVRAGETVALRHITGGLRAYIAVHGSSWAAAPRTPSSGLACGSLREPNCGRSGVWHPSASRTTTCPCSGSA